MNLTEIPKFDPSLFRKRDLDVLQTLADACEVASTAGEIEAVGVKLDQRRDEYRKEVRNRAAQSYAMNAYFKVLVREVPRGTNSEGKMVARPERLAE